MDAQFPSYPSYPSSSLSSSPVFNQPHFSLSSSSRLFPCPHLSPDCGYFLSTLSGGSSHGALHSSGLSGLYLHSRYFKAVSFLPVVMRRTVSRLLEIIVSLSAACGAKGCRGLRHVENGRTFSRYGGLLVIFQCHPGYTLHGFRTTSCVSGRWSRDPPVCVGEELHSSAVNCCQQAHTVLIYLFIAVHS